MSVFHSVFQGCIIGFFLRKAVFTEFELVETTHGVS